MSHARQTEHYELPLYDGTDIINPLTDFNNANETIDEAVYNANQRSVSAETIAQNAKTIAESYETRVTQAIDTANSASSLATNTQAMIANEFNPTKEGGYKVGDFVIYNGVLYRFINVHTGAWDASDVQVSPVLIDAISDVVDEGKQDIADAVADAKEEIAGQTEKVTKTQAMIAQAFDENKTDGYAVGEIVTYADKLYRFTSAHSGAWTGLDVEQVDIINEIKGEVLWNNSDPTTAFAGQTIALSLSDYSYVEIKVVWSNTHSTDLGYKNIKVYVGEATQDAWIAISAIAYRNINVTTTGVIFGDAYIDGTVNNVNYIPVQIKGYK